MTRAKRLLSLELHERMTFFCDYFQIIIWSLLIYIHFVHLLFFSEIFNNRATQQSYASIQSILFDCSIVTAFQSFAMTTSMQLIMLSYKIMYSWFALRNQFTKYLQVVTSILLVALDSHDSCHTPFSEIHRQNDNKLRRPNRIYDSFKKWTHWMRVQVYFTIAGSSSIFFNLFFLKTIFFSCFFLRFQVEWMQRLKKINAVTVYISFRLRQTSQQGVSIIYTDWWKKMEYSHFMWIEIQWWLFQIFGGVTKNLLNFFAGNSTKYNSTYVKWMHAKEWWINAKWMHAKVVCLFSVHFERFSVYLMRIWNVKNVNDHRRCIAKWILCNIDHLTMQDTI